MTADPPLRQDPVPPGPIPPGPMASGDDRTARRRLRDRLLMAGLLALFLAGMAGLVAATGWSETTDAREAVRLVLDHLDGAEGLGNAGHRSHSPTE